MRSIVTNRVAWSVGRSVTLVSGEPCKNGWADRDDVWVEESDVHREPRIRWGADPPVDGQFWGKGSPIVQYRDLLPWAMQKWLNRSILRLGSGLGWDEGSISSIIFATWEGTLAPPGEYIRLNRPSAAAMRSYVKLLWPLVSFNQPLLIFPPANQKHPLEIPK